MFYKYQTKLKLRNRQKLDALQICKITKKMMCTVQIFELNQMAVTQLRYDETSKVSSLIACFP